MLPQKPPKDLFTPLGQKRRQPTARIARPSLMFIFSQQFKKSRIVLPAINVILNPYLRTIHPEIVNGQMKYAAKYEACNPDDLPAVMFKVV